MLRLTFGASQAAATLIGRQSLRSPPMALRDMLQQAWRRNMAQQSGSGGRVLEKLLGRAPPPSGTLVGTRTTMLRSGGMTTGRVMLRSAGGARPIGRRGISQSAKARKPAKGHQARPKEPPEESLSIGARMRKLSREYGWATVGVYFALSVLDFPFCFLLVRMVGTDRIAEAEHWVVSNVSQFVPASVKEKWHEAKGKWDDWRHPTKDEEPIADVATIDGAVVADDAWGVKEAQQRNKNEASLATQLALAYAIHKSFIFIRVPLTAAVTPRVVKILRSWGWQIGKRRSKR